MKKEQFASYLIDNYQDDSMLPNFIKFKDYLVELNKVMNLTGITEDEEVYEKHFYDSIFYFNEHELKDLIKEGTNILDLGSGAGFPGIPLAICYPKANFVLVEPITKRVNFLNDVIKLLGLKNVKVINERGEKLKNYRQSFDIVTARAVTNLSNLLEIVVPLLKIGGDFVALKGKHFETKQEIKNCSNASSVLGSNLKSILELNLPNGEERTIVQYGKLKPTPNMYPRDFALIKKKPL